MSTYINLIQHSDGIEFDIDMGSGARVPPQLIAEGDSYHGTYLIPAPPEKAMELIKALLSMVANNGKPPKAKRKKAQKKLAQFEVAPYATH